MALDFDPEIGLADSGHLEHDLRSLLEAAGEAARRAQTAIVLLIDKLLYVREEELAALITALHRIAQRQLPITPVGAGLPHLRGRIAKAKSYAERLFDFSGVDSLGAEDARATLVLPARAQGVAFEAGALERIIK